MNRKHIHRNISISDFYHGYNGLEITATYFGEEFNRDLSREETMNYLDSAGVVLMRDGMCLVENKWISYEDWRTDYELTDEDIKDVIMLIRSSEEMKRATNRIMNPAA